jgi:hypothetical protein
MMIMLLTSCYLYTGECRVERVPSPPLPSEECSAGAHVLAQTLAHSIGDAGWTPVGVLCSLYRGT